MKNENYITIQGWMVNELNLKGNELIVYALIYGFSQDEESTFNGSYEYISNSLNITRRATISLIEKLEKNRLVKKIHHQYGNSYQVVKKIHHTSEKNSPVASEKNSPNSNLINNYINNDNSQQSCDPSHDEILVEPPKETYKTKRKIHAQKDIPYTPRKKSSKQEEFAEAMKVLDYFKEQGHEQHGMMFMQVRDESRNKKVRAQIVRIVKEVGTEKCKELIDYWFEGEGEWARYEPEQCFTTRSIEAFLNKNNKKEEIIDLK